MAVQTTYGRPGQAKPRAASLTIDVTSMDEDGIADLRRKLDAFASKLDAEFGREMCSVKVY